jgi:hypothetical protein
MSDRTPPGEGVGTKPGAIEQMLRDAKEALKMDVAFVSEFEGIGSSSGRSRGTPSPSGGKKAKASPRRVLLQEDARRAHPRGGPRR